MNSKKVESGMNTEAIATLIELSMPPRRADGEGITVPELVKTLGCTKSHAKKVLDERDDLICVVMLGNTGKEVHVWMPEEDAKDKYENWIKTS